MAAAHPGVGMTDDLLFLREQAALLSTDPYNLAATAQRYGIHSVKDLLALIATDGRQDFAALVSTAEQTDRSAGSRVPTGYHVRAVGALAQLMVGRGFRDERYEQAALLHRFGYALGSAHEQPPRFQRLLLQTNLMAGETAYVRRLLATDPTIADDHTRWLVRAELLGPTLAGAAFDPAAWSASFSEIFTDHGVPAVRLDAAAGSLFNGIRIARPELLTPVGTSADDPLVTVIMSVYAPDESLETAVRSILDQTWQRFELFVVDDQSPADYTDRIHAVADWDPRITVLTTPENGGTYKVRNVALHHARGEFVTFQDSDDWSHPERLARQVAHLTAHPEVVANLSSWVRITPDLSANRVGYASTRVNASSLMFRRTQVLDALGGFDPVRKEADTEFRSRLTSTFGEEAVVPLDDILAVAQLTTDSLSRNDFSFGWRAQTRDAYVTASGHWHEAVRAGVASPYLDPAGPRTFPAPHEFLDRSPVPAVTCDVAYVSDWRERLTRYAGAPRRVRALVDSGLSVHVAQAQHLEQAYRLRRSPVRAVREMQARGDIAWINWNHPRHAAVTIVDSPELLLFPRDASEVQLTTERLVVVAAGPPRVGGRALYDVGAVERHARTLFGVEAHWLPATQQVSVALAAAGATNLLPPRGVMVADAEPHPRRGLRGRRPTIGSAFIDRRALHQPTVDELLQCLPDDDAYDVRLLEDDVRVGVAARVFTPRPPGNWLILKPSAITPREFYRSLDVFVGFAPSAWGGEPSWPMLDAAGAGAVVVVDPRHESVLGDAALYAEPAQVRKLVDDLLVDPAELAAQQDRALDRIRQHHAPSSFATYVAELAGLNRLVKESHG